MAETDPGQPQPPADRFPFDAVPLRQRADGLTPEKQRAYVEALADTGIAREAAARVGVSEQAVNRVRRRADARSFDRACEAARIFAARQLRSIAWERAIEGTLRGHYYHGERVSEERVYDNRLLIYLLSKTEHLIQPPAGAHAICTRWDEHMEALEQGAPRAEAAPAAPAALAEATFDGDEVTQDDDGVWWTTFPPPAGFDGEEEGEYGDDDYQRTLTPREQAVMDADEEAEVEDQRRAGEALRDSFFGFAGNEISSPMEAETYETSAPVGAPEPPLEFKSLPPPAWARRPGAARTGGIGPAGARGVEIAEGEPFPVPAHFLDSVPTGGPHGRAGYRRAPRRERNAAAALAGGHAALDLGDGPGAAADARTYGQAGRAGR